jgi:hypothetical protein
LTKADPEWLATFALWSEAIESFLCLPVVNLIFQHSDATPAPIPGPAIGEIMPLKIDDKELFAIDSHTHMGRRKTPLGHGIASFLGEDLVRDMDELGVQRDDRRRGCQVSAKNYRLLPDQS